MKRTAALLVIACGILLAVAGCGPTTPTSTTPASPGSQTTSSGVSSNGQSPGNQVRPFKMVNKDKVYLHVTKTYDPAQYPKTTMNGEPSNIHFFKPTKDEGVLNRDYPAYDSKTFKFLSLTGSTLPPQWYYMFSKNGGTLNKAVAKTGYKFADVLDEGHIKILPNFYLGYYDFAWVPLNVITEYWSGNESMNQELWRDGNDYVIVGASYDGGISLLAPPTITSLKDLAGKSVGIMNPSFNIEALLNKKLSTLGMATESAGGNVKVEMASPGFVLNDLAAMKNSASFSWGMYANVLLSPKAGYRELVNWKDMGYGTKVPYYVLVVRKDILKKHPDIVQTVVQLNYDATKRAITVGDYKTPMLATFNAFKVKYMGIKTSQARPALVLPDAQANPAFLHDLIDYMTKCDYFRTPYTYSDLVDETFYNKVKK